MRQAVERDDRDAAWDLLCDADQSALKARAADLGEGIDPKDVLLSDRRRLPPWRDLQVSEKADTAEVIVVLDDGQDVRRAVRERGGWRVVLGVQPP